MKTIRSCMNMFIGDKIEVRKHSNPRRFYRGLIERVLEDRFILRFRRDFMDEYNSGNGQI